MTKKIRKFINYLIQLTFLLVLLFLLAQQGKVLLVGFLEDQLQKVFLGKVHIEDIAITPDSICLLDVSIDDASQPVPSALFFVRRIEIPIPYYWLKDKTIPLTQIQVSGLRLKLEQGRDKKLNFMRNLKIRKGKRDVVIPVRKIIIKDSLLQFKMPVKNIDITFIGREIFGNISFYGSSMLFNLQGQEDHAGPVSSEGHIDFRKMDCYFGNKAERILLEDRFNQTFMKVLFPFFQHFDFKGVTSLDMPIIRRSNKWQPIRYHLQLEDLTLRDHRNLSGIRDFTGELFIEGKKMAVHNATAHLSIKDILLPFTNLNIDSAFDRESIRNSMKGDVFSGKMDGKLDFVFRESYHSELHFKDCRLEEMVSFYYKDYDKPLGGKFFLDADILALKEKKWQMEAEGGFYIREGDFFQFPVFVNIFNFLNFDFSDEKKNQTADVTWSYKEGDLIFQEIKISGKSIALFGEGIIKKQGDIDFVFTTELNRKNLLSTPLVGDIARDVSNEIMKKLITVKVSGTLKNPKVKKESVEQVPVKAIGYFVNILKALTAPLAGEQEKKNGHDESK